MPISKGDAFADAPFAGNPAAVVLLTSSEARRLDNATRQNIAAEMNLGATAIVELLQNRGEVATFRKSRGSDLCIVFKLSWYSPLVELKLCGHGTLAASAILYEEGNTSEQLVFQTKHSGDLIVKQGEPSSGFQLQMDLPCGTLPTEAPPPWAAPLCKALLGQSGVAVAETAYNSATQCLLVELEVGTTRDQLEGIKPDFSACLAAVGADKLLSVIVTMKGMPGPLDFLSRVFLPWAGINEDAVTGSAHTVLAPWWASKLKRNSLTARQCSSRGGELRLIVEEAGQRIQGIQVLGNAISISSGLLFL